MDAAALKTAADSEELEAAWRHIQADFLKAYERRNRLYEGRVGFWELMASRSLSKLIAEAESEVDRLHGMLKAIDAVRSAARDADEPNPIQQSPLSPELYSPSRILQLIEDAELAMSKSKVAAQELKEQFELAISERD